jgi:hypothetical protein
VLLSDRLRLLDQAHGAVTLVLAFRATGAERASALDSLATYEIVMRLRRNAAQGERHRLVEAFELISPGGLLAYRHVSDEFLVEPVLDAARDGRVLAVPGWVGFSGYAAGAPEAAQASPDARICARAMRGADGLVSEGQTYRLVPATAWPAGAGFEVVPKPEALATLYRIEGRAQGDQKAALVEAISMLADTRTRQNAGGLFLVRKSRPESWGGGSSRSSEPVLSPSQLRTARAETRTWFEVMVIDEVGEPVSGADLVFEVDGGERHETTSGAGRARIEDARSRSATVRLADPKALRAQLDTKWTQGREREWIEPSANIVEVWAAGGKPPPVSLSAEKPAEIMLWPPQRVRLLDHERTALAGVACTVTVAGASYKLTSDGAGWIEFPIGVESCPESATVEWSETHDGVTRTWAIDVVLECHEGAPDDVARARLQALGYEVDDMARALAEFRRDRELPEDNAGDDQISPELRDEIADAFEEAHA